MSVNFRSQGLHHPTAAEAAAGAPRGALAPAGRGFRTSLQASLVVGALTLLAGLLGLSVEGVYRTDPATAQMLRGFDLVAVLVVVPGLAVALRSARRGSLAGRLSMVSLLSYLVYTYAYYLFGTGFHDLLLLHVAVFIGSLAALAAGLASFEATEVAGAFRSRTRVGLVAGVLGLLAVALGSMWAYASLAFALAGTLPAGSMLVETEQIVHLGIVLDLTVLVPLYAAAAVLVFRRTGWGYLLAVVALVSGVLHQVSYQAALALQAWAGVPGAVAFDPFEPVITLVYLVGLVALLGGWTRGRPGAGRPSR